MAQFPSSLVRFCLFAGLLLALPVASRAAELTRMELREVGDHAQVEFALSASAEYKVFTLDNPSRLVLDLKGSRLAEGYRTAPLSGPVSAVRTGSPSPGDLRVVLDLVDTIRPKTFLLPPGAGAGQRLVVELYPASAAAPGKTVQDLVPDTGRDVVIAIDAGHGGQDPGARGATGTWEKNITLAVARELVDEIARRIGANIPMQPGDVLIIPESRL